MTQIDLLWRDRAEATADRLLAGYKKPNRAVRRQLVIRARGLCVYCRREPERFSLDHIVPFVRGGSTGDIRNLAMACPDCNRRKSFRTAAEFGHPEVVGFPAEPTESYAAWCRENRSR